MLVEHSDIDSALTLTQQDIYFDQIKSLEQPFYNVGGYIQISKVDIHKLCNAHKQLVETYDAFGVRLKVESGVVSQYISKERNSELEVLDFSSMKEPEQYADNWLENLFCQVIDVDGEALFKAFLLDLGTQGYRYVGIAHHIIMDGVGFYNWAQVIGQLYRGETTDKASLKWHEIVVKETEYLESERYRKDKAFWEEHIQKISSGMFGNRYHRFEDKSVGKKSERKTWHLSSSDKRRVTQLAEVHGVAESQVYLAALLIYFYRGYHRSQLTIGLPVHNRRTAKEKHTIGVFTGINAFAGNIRSEMTLSCLIAEVARQQKQIYRHQRYPIGELLRKLKIAESQKAPFDVDFNYLKLGNDIEFDSESTELHYLSHFHERTPFTFTIWDSAGTDCTDILIDYQTSMFCAKEINWFCQRMSWLFEQMLTDAHLPIDKISLLSEQEHEQLLNFSNYPVEQKVHCANQGVYGAFYKTATLHLDRTAAICEHKVLSYVDLIHKVTTLSEHLTHKLNLPVGASLAVCMERSTDLLVTLLASQRSGLVFVPIDPSAPEERVKYILSDANVALVLTSSMTSGKIAEQSVAQLCWDSQAESQAPISADLASICYGHEEAIAYVIYTSGSTGKPKGVAVEQQAIVKHIESIIDYLSIDEHDVSLQLNAYSFDTFLEQTLACLFSGAAVVLSSDQLIAPDAFIQYVRQHNVSITDLTPAYLSLLLKHSDKQLWSELSLGRVVVGGEALSHGVVNEWFSQGASQHCKLYNAYGPTEAVITSLIQEISEFDGHCVRIGKPLKNRSVYLLDENQSMAPIGMTGEIYIGGPLASHYLNKEDITSKAFINNPYGNGKLYRSGDLAYRLPTGELVFAGRIDEQIKIRGYRIEPAEIETVIIELADVKLAAIRCCYHITNEPYLAAYLVLADDSLEVSDTLGKVKQKVKELLPEYMRPQAFVVIDNFPLTTNGKIDWGALPKPDLTLDAESIEEPGSSLEEKLRDIWADLLTMSKEQVCVNTHFFEMGGHSLLIPRMIEAIAHTFDSQLSSRDVFKDMTIRAIARCIQGTHGRAFAPIEKTTSVEQVTLSTTQFRIWFAEQLNKDSNAHNISGGVRVRGELNFEHLQLAVNSLFREHRVLKAKVAQLGDDVFQSTHHAESLDISFHDLSSFNTDKQELEARAIGHEHSVKHFDLKNDLLLRVMVIKLSDQEWMLYLSFHHLIADGWSLSLFVNQLFSRYENIESIPKENEHQLDFFDYSIWQQEFFKTHHYQEQKDFWISYLDGAQQKLSLFPVSAKNWEKENVSNEVVYKLPSDLSHQIRLLSRQYQGSLFNFFQSSFSLLLSRLTGEKDLIIGAPVAGRNIPGTEDMLGVFLNNLPIRSQVDSSQSFVGYFKQQIDNVANVLSNQDVPFEHILQEVEVERSDSTPLFQVFINFLNIPQIEMENSRLKAEYEYAPEIDSKFELTLYIDDSHDEVELKFHFDLSKYSRSAIKLMVSQYIRLIEGIALDESLPCSQYDLNGTAQQNVNELAPIVDCLPRLNQSLSMSWPGPVHECFRQHASSSPEQVALSSSQRNWTYQQLDKISDGYAKRLKELGLKKGDVVAIVAKRNDWLVVAMLAVFKSGGAYVLVTEDSPASRLTYQLDVTEPCFLMTLDESSIQSIAINNWVEENRCCVINICHHNFDDFSDLDALELSVDPLDVAYLTFTSGTEGQPKVIRGCHGSLTAYTPWMAQTFKLDECSRFGMLSGLMHDPLQRDIFTPLSIGASLFIPGDADYQPGVLGHWVQEKEITSLHLTPSLSRFILSESIQSLPDLQHIFFSGEPLVVEHVKRLKNLAPRVDIINVYGSTETSRAVSYCHVKSERDLELSTVPVGTGVADVQAVILSDDLNTCSIGELGQIGIRSPFLTLGYHNDATRTSVKFITNPYTGDVRDRIYLTGDLGYYLANGDIVCMGRMDRQIKIRGFRIEPAEIERAILNIDGVEKVVVDAIKKEHSDEQIIAFVSTKDNKSIDISLIKSHLRQSLMSYMIPADIILLNDIPLTGNGKVDHKQLRSKVQIGKPRELIAPANEYEQAVIDMWKMLLETQDICVSDAFFDIGGHSLLVTRFFSMVKESFDIELDYRDFFERHSVKEVAQLIEQKVLLNRVTDKKEKKNKISL
ncbi:non-ribosomal peptide synthetase [Pleionea sp. CnH1-48]|uniref:non-ribosomal peptide synthetase n=1 Tax=Pleionea sp. CnH1-48 TaxID=2954494 RepID=UPI0020975096|nr:non-ribosomal peptide synthetase [Pleionea sp. CnH1-48]MCO7226822.1 amino acid adenylation domain-containing protein [Pleionea sp. CnH1-48]